MYTLPAAVIIILATLENLWPSVSGFLKAPQGFVFLGTVHHPGDYFYYLSQFTQGDARILTALNLYSSESIPASFVGWSNVLSGRLFHLVGVPPIPAYHISLAALTIGAFLAAWALCREIFPKTSASLTAFFLFGLFHAFPVMRDGVSSYGDYWNNYAVPRVRMGGVPHHLIIVIASILIVYFVIRIVQKNQSSPGKFTGLALSGFMLASLQPALWVLLVGCIGLAVISYQAPGLGKIIRAVKHAAPAIITLTLSGLLPLLYLARLFQSLPFSQLKSWEATQQTPLTSEHFLTATGPVFLVAVFSLPFVLTGRIFSRYLIIIFTTASLILFLSPVPALIGISHVRFMSTLAILGLSVIAGFGVYTLLTAPIRWVRAAGITLLLLLTGISLPNHMKTLRLVSAFTPANTTHYLRERDYALLREAGAQSSPDDIFLVAAPYDTVFPALSGRRTYYGHPLLTINAEEKQSFSRMFFSTAVKAGSGYDAIRKNNISWIIAPASPEQGNIPHWMKLVSQSDTLRLYRVQN